MAYPLEFVPFIPPTAKPRKADGAAYLNWYLTHRDRRIQFLCRFLGVPLGQEENSDLITIMLAAGKWLSDNATLVEIELSQLEASYGVKDPSMFLDLRDRTLSPETFFFCYDMGMVFTKILLSALPDAKLTVLIKNRRDMYYGQVVIAGTGFIDIEPFHLCRVMACKAIKGRLSEAEVLRTIQVEMEAPERERKAREQYERETKE